MCLAWVETKEECIYSWDDLARSSSVSAKGDFLITPAASCQEYSDRSLRHAWPPPCKGNTNQGSLSSLLTFCMDSLQMPRASTCTLDYDCKKPGLWKCQESSATFVTQTCGCKMWITKVAVGKSPRWSFTVSPPWPTLKSRIFCKTWPAVARRAS